jgi:predicted AlkP superfamily pyrophosphatase or phosphodiesterase
MRPCLLLPLLFALPLAAQQTPPRHNVILVVADGLRRDSVTAADMPTFLALRHAGTDFPNSHSAFPTFTTANASVIATGHGIGDTGDYSNTLYPGVWLTKPENLDPTGYLTPFIENDLILADMNAAFNGNYLGERTLLSAAQQHGYNVAAIGKLGPAAIQQIDQVSWTPAGYPAMGSAILIDDATGSIIGLPLPTELREQIEAAGLPTDAPIRNNGFAENSQFANGFQGDAKTPGTLAANTVQQQWFADITTKVLLPRFEAQNKPFVMVFWSRDPDGVQHNEGDSLQQLTPGINGETSKRGLRNADHDLRQILDYLEAHPALKANTDVIVTSDHGFATISRREIQAEMGADGNQTSAVSAGLEYELSGKEAAQTRGTLPTGFLAVDLAVRGNMRLYDAGVRSIGGASSVFQELTVGGERSQHPSGGSALLGTTIQHLDGSDARLIIASNGGSDLLYVPSADPKIVQSTLAILAQLDYVGGLFVDDKYCPTPQSCPGALPLSSVGLVGSSKVPRPSIVVTYKVFYQRPGDLLSAVQISDTTLQEGQGMHGGFGREQTLNNMAAMGPDFKPGFVDPLAMGNIDLAPTLAHIFGFELPAVGTLKGRVLAEALREGTAVTSAPAKLLVSPPAADGSRTVLQYQEQNGVRYYDQACYVGKAAPAKCP